MISETNKAARVRLALAAGALTSADVADLCKISRRHANAWIYLLVRSGHARRTNLVVRHERMTGPSRLANGRYPYRVYELTHAGRLKMAADERRRRHGAH